jgi:hypothetical protein
MNINAFMILIGMLAAGIEIVGLAAIRYGKSVSLPVFVELGRTFCYVAPVMLVVGLIVFVVEGFH